MGRVGVGLELEWGGLRRWRSSPTAFLMEWARKAKLELRGVEVELELAEFQWIWLLAHRSTPGASAGMGWSGLSWN